MAGSGVLDANPLGLAQLSVCDRPSWNLVVALSRVDLLFELSPLPGATPSSAPALLTRDSSVIAPSFWET